jgi:hypothetical protein
MRHTPKTLAKAASALTPDEQADLIDRLLQPTTISEWDHDWAVEGGARASEVDQGTAELTDADEVMAEGRRRLGVRRRQA